MSPAKPKLTVTPELCEGCPPGKYDCQRACKQQAIRVGRGFVYVDWEKCDGCLECVDMCDTGALEPREGDTRPGAVTVASVGGGAFSEQKSSTPTAAVPRDPPPRRVWDEIDAFIALTVLLGTLVLLNAALSLKVVALMPPSGRVLARAAGLAIAYGIELVVLWLLARRHGVGFIRAFGLRPVFRSAVSAGASAVLVVAMFVGTRLLTTVYGLITQALHWEPVFEWSNSLTKVFGEGWLGLGLTVVLIALFGPFVEELTFRGVVQTAAHKRWGMWWGIVGTSALFAVYHFDPWMFFPTFTLGLALGWLAEKRHGLWPSIALHVLYNGVTVVAVFWLAAK